MLNKILITLFLCLGVAMGSTPIKPTTYTIEAFEGQSQNPTTGVSTSLIITPQPYLADNAPYGRFTCLRKWASNPKKESYHFKGTVNEQDSFFLSLIIADSYKMGKPLYMSSYIQQYVNGKIMLIMQFVMDGQTRFLKPFLDDSKIYTPSLYDQKLPYHDGGIQCTVEYSGDTDETGSPTIIK